MKVFLFFYICLSYSVAKQTILTENLIENWLTNFERATDTSGTLTEDVQNWSTLIENYILQLASTSINRKYTQEYFDLANYTVEAKSGEEVVRAVQRVLTKYFLNKQKAAYRIADKVQEIYDRQFKLNRVWNKTERLRDLNLNFYRDADIPKLFPKDMKFSSRFKQKVSFSDSIIKISDEIPRNAPATINTVVYTKQLDKTFKLNYEQDPTLRWQYFGSSFGLMRLYPAREWDTNFAGFYDDYDPRVRNWYISATSGPKDVIVIIDCSLSMSGEKFEIAKSVAITVIDTLTPHDYVNVICARDSHWDEVGNLKSYATEVLSCQQNRIVPATLAHRRDLKYKVSDLVAGGTSELEKAFDIAFNLLNSNQRTACQSVIVFITDGSETDGETVRCGPGFYTRSGYVPGPICIYNWTNVWDIVETRNNALEPTATIFSYLAVDDSESLPGHLACENGGSFQKLTDGENLISKMSNYFEYLSSSIYTKEDGIWTNIYIDNGGLGLTLTYAVPVISRKDSKLIGVAAVDATLEEIQNIMANYQWGDVYSFLINKNGETIVHPMLSTSSQNIIEDPILVQITKLEQDNNGEPNLFNKVLDDMINGISGILRIENAIRMMPKRNIQPSTYYYASLEGTDYSFAYSLSDTDVSFREISEPTDLSKYKKNYFNLLKEYNSTKGRQELPNEYETLDVKVNDPKYPGLRVSYKYSSIFFAPTLYCDPNEYFYDEDLSSKTIDAHHYINSHILNKTFRDLDCKHSGFKYKKGTRAYVLISQPIEDIWIQRPYDLVKEIKWTNVGMRNGVFRTYPGHRSNRLYSPVNRPWYKRSLNAPEKTTLSAPYFDAAGAGKIITISQAVFEGMLNVTKEYCETQRRNSSLRLLDGCHCKKNSDCVSGVCYVSKAPGFDINIPRCATNRLIGVTGTDIAYNDFHKNVMKKMQSSNGKKSCGFKYQCPDGIHTCETRCYLFDANANLIVAPDFIHEKDLEEKKYSQVNLGKLEGEVMKELIYRHNLFIRTENIDFSGTCTISPYRPKVTLKDIPVNPEDQDNYYKNRGPIPSFQNDYGCIQDAVRYSVNKTALGKYRTKILIGNVSGPCMNGYYYVAALPKTNLFLLVIENFENSKESYFFNFHCQIIRSIVTSGNFHLINGTCAHQDLTRRTTREDGKCQQLRKVELQCQYNNGMLLGLRLFYTYLYVALMCSSLLM